MRTTGARSLLVLLAVALICSVLVSVSAVVLRPVQMQNELIERYRNIVSLTGLVEEDGRLDDDALLAVVARLDVRVVNLETGRLVSDIAPEEVDARGAVNDPARSVAIPGDEDPARLGRRSIYEVIYLVWDDGRLSRVILPIHGLGMWSTLYGYLALEADLNTIAAVSFYEQEETAGLGDQIENADWQQRWAGRRLFGPAGEVRFRVARGAVDDASPEAAYQVDGLSGATITASAVTALVRFWVGAGGYGPLFRSLRENPPELSTGTTEEASHGD